MRWTLRKSLMLFICFMVTLMFAALGELLISVKMANAQNSMNIVSNGQANAVVVVTGNADAQTSKAANVLVEYVKKSTGAEMAIVTEDQFNSASGFNAIYVGESALHKDPTLSTVLEGLKQDGFIIRPLADSIAVIGTTSWGTTFAVNEFLERFVGVRWLMPGAIGEDVPAQADIIAPLEEVVREPAFKDRMISPIIPGQTARFPVQTEWAERNNTRYSSFFHHMLYNYFPASLYGTTHPEFYPKRNGVTYIPPAGVTTGWQPCFSVAGTVDAAVQGVLKYLSQNPAVPSVSLGVNDSGGFCVEDSEVPGKTLSDVYYDWVNQVVEQVLETYPDKWFGLLAYGPLEAPPSFPLHPRVIPFVTKDRMAWSDGDVKAAGESLTERWAQVTVNTGWYDYTYGSVYAVPRVYPHLMADYIRFSEQNHVSSHYTELYPNWGEGPKPWLMAKLLWDPNQNVDLLLDEWYKRAVGEQAASDLKAYYDHWEQFWTERVQATDWFETGKDMTYLGFNSGGYMNIVMDEEIARSRQLLESVVSKAETSDQKARAEILLQAFAQYEAAAYSYPKWEEPPTDATAAIAVLDRIASNLDEKLYWAGKRNTWIDYYKSDPILVLPFAPVIWSGWNSYDFWGLVDYLKQYEPAEGPVRERVRELALEAISPNIRKFTSLLLQLSSGQLTNLVSNSSFEDGTDSVPPWFFWISTTGTIMREEGIAHTGNASIRINDLERGGPAQIIPVHSGLVALRAHYYTPIGGNGSVQLQINLMNAQKMTLTSRTSELKNASKTTGEWASIELLEEVPAKYQGTEIKYIQVVVVVNQVPKESSLYLDDISVYQSGLPEDSDLEYLSVSGAPDILFNPSQTDYTVEVGSDATSVDLKARSASDNVLMMIYGNPLMSGTPRKINLQAGINTIPVMVIAPGGAIKKYTVKIIRE